MNTTTIPAALLLILLLAMPPSQTSTTSLTCQVRQHRQKRVCWCAPGPQGPWTTYPMLVCRLTRNTP